MDLNREQIEARIARNTAGIARIDADGGPRHSMEKETYDWWVEDNALCTLALRGLEGQWRPIASLPPTRNPETASMLIKPAKLKNPIYSQYIGDGCWQDGWRRHEIDWYLPLSALPAPPEGK